MSDLYRTELPVWGSTAVLAVTESEAGPEALAVLLAQIEAFDLACSRFRPDSELVRLNAAPAGVPVPVSPLLRTAIETGLRAAATTGGLVDPTVGTALELLGYDRDFAAVNAAGPAVDLTLRPVPGWKALRVDRVSSAVTRPTGGHLDLGATAKAWCADVAAARIAETTGAGVLVGLGGDVSIRGPAPRAGWPIKIADDHAEPIDTPGPTVSIVSGGVATSSTAVRRWRRGDQVHHHLIDPATGLPAEEYWRTVSVAAASCLDANIASCASMLLGPAAPAWLSERSLPARLQHRDGSVLTICGWPEDRSGAERELARC
jgi:FAD:protein FMN transferase